MWGALIMPAETTPRRARPWSKRARVTLKTPWRRSYLGLALSQDGDRQRGLKEIQTGLSGLGGWFDYMQYYSLYGAYWDPGRIIRSRIEKDLAATQGKEINWTDLIASVELVAMQVEREADAVREQLRKDRRDWDERAL